MLNLIINVSRFIDIAILAMFFILGIYSYRCLPSQKKAAPMATYQFVLIILFLVLSLCIIVLRTQQNDGDIMRCLIWFSVTIAAMILMYVLACTVFNGTSRLLWNSMMMLLSISIVMLWRLNSNIAIQQIKWMGLCFVLVSVILFAMRGDWLYKIPPIVFMIVSAGMIVLPFVFPLRDGWTGGSQNWAQIKGFSFQPSEFVKLSFVFLIGYLYSRPTAWRNLITATVMTGFLGLVLLKQNDLGGLLIFGIVFWFMSYEYLDRSWILWAGILAVAVAGVGAYKFVYHVRVRVDAWFNPWNDISGGGYQIAHSLFAIAGGGWLGKGLFKGMPTYIPVNTTDMIYAAICEEFGGIFGILLILLYGLMFMIMVQYASHEREDHKRSLLLGFAILFMTQTFIIIGGVIKLLPLTGVTLPFISYGGSSMLSMICIFGIIQGIICSSYPAGKEKAYAAEQQQPPTTAKRPEYRQQQPRYQQSQYQQPQQYQQPRPQQRPQQRPTAGTGNPTARPGTSSSVRPQNPGSNGSTAKSSKDHIDAFKF